MESPAILGLGTAVPPFRQSQATISAWMRAAFADDPALARWLGLLYAGSGITTRYNVLPEMAAPPAANRFAPTRAPEASPSTAERMRLYQAYAPALGLAAAQPLVADPEAVTHLIVCSCTGLYAPGLDLDLAVGLGLRRDVKRTFVGFMGCAAGMTSLRLATEIVQGSPEALVLVVSVECCSLHLQPTRDREALIGASLFGDGAGAALVGRRRAGLPGLFALDRFASVVTPETESAMVWTVGDNGFALRLSPKVPEHVAAATPGLVAGLVGGRPNFWAVHPGGKGILDRLERACELEPEALEPSRWVLRERGNLSSATIFHVLERWAERLVAEAAAPCPGVAVAFGPGLVTELASLRWLGAGAGLAARAELGGRAEFGARVEFGAGAEGLDGRAPYAEVAGPGVRADGLPE